MKEELLKELGIKEEEIKQIQKIHYDIIAEKYVPKTDYDNIVKDFEAEKVKVKDRDTKLESLKGIDIKDIEELKGKIKTLQTEISNKDTLSQNALIEERKRNAIKLAWIEEADYKPRDLDWALDKIEISKVEINEKGKILSGFKEQRDNIIKEKPDMFKTIDDKGGENKHTGTRVLGTEPADSNANDNNGGSKNTSFGAELAKKQATRRQTKTVEDINPWATNIS